MRSSLADLTLDERDFWKEIVTRRAVVQNMAIAIEDADTAILALRERLKPSVPPGAPASEGYLKAALK